jgi:hypothetical protein
MGRGVEQVNPGWRFAHPGCVRTSAQSAPWHEGQKEENRAVMAGFVMGRVWSLRMRPWPPVGGRMGGVKPDLDPGSRLRADQKEASRNQ